MSGENPREANFFDMAKKLFANRGNILATFVVLILSMMLIPVPTFVLDIGFVINFALSIAVILVTMYAKDPLEFSTFPTVLLLITLGRLALEVSATRAILLNGHAGAVIHSIGEFVIGGNFVVGVIIFIILFVINFMVVTQGAGRVSEVAARFALDSMPGKQLAVDADLNAGIIDEATAKKRRRDISREADFYSTMDGGSKFVKGDAIASIIIAVINICGGFIIGMLMLGLSAGESASLYTILTVGEGLASQIPALIISIATGIIVTRSDPDVNLATDVGTQLFGRPEVLAAASLAMLLLGVGIQGAFLPFTAVAGALGYFAFKQYVAQRIAEEDPEKAEQERQIEEKLAKRKEDNSPDGVMKLLKVDQMEIEVGYKLVQLLDPDKEGDLLDRIGQIRKQLMVSLGLPVPAIRVHDNLQLSSNDYQIKLRGVVIARGSVMADKYLAVNTGLVDPNEEKLEGIETVEPSYGLPAIWISEDEREKAEVNGYTVATPSAVLATHLTEVIRSYAHEILSRQDLVRMLDQVKQYNESIVEEVCPNLMGTGEVLSVLQNLLKEQISIRDMSSILEVLASFAKVNKEADFLSEKVRQGMGRHICSDIMSGDCLDTITLHPSIEEDLINSLHMDRLALEPVKAKLLIERLKEGYELVSSQGNPPILLCNSKVRLPLRKITERTVPEMVIVAYNEVPHDIEAKSIHMVEYGNPELSDAQPEPELELESSMPNVEKLN